MSKSKIVLDLGFWIYFGFGNIWILDLIKRGKNAKNIRCGFT